MLVPGTGGKRREKLITEKCEILDLDSDLEVGVWQRMEEVQQSGPRSLWYWKGSRDSCNEHPAFAYHLAITL